MPRYEYLVVPFIGEVKTGFFSKEGPETASRQLQTVINSYAQQGWDFDQLCQITILTKPGCLGSMFGREATPVVFDQVIFRKTV
jgi:hypothetical protein